MWDFWRWWEVVVGWEQAVTGGYAARLACAHIPQELWLFRRSPPSTKGCISAQRSEWGISQEQQLQRLPMLGPGNSRVNRTECLPPLGTPSPVREGAGL